MDVNGTRFHLLLGRGDFGGRCHVVAEDGTSRSLEQVFQSSSAGAGAAFSWSAGPQEVTLGVRVFNFTPSAANVAVSLGDRRGAASDVHGNLYWIAENRVEILVHSSGSRKTTHFWSSLDDPRARSHATAAGSFAPIPSDTEPQPIRFQGLAVTSLHYLVVGTRDPAGLLVFDLHRGGEPRQLLWPADLEFEPFDLAATPGGGLIVLDRLHRRLWGLDHTLGVVDLTGASASNTPQDLFGPLDAALDAPIDAATEPKPPCRRTITSSSSLELAGVLSPVAVDALPDGSAIVLESDPAARFSLIHRCDRGEAPFELKPPGAPVSTGIVLSLVEESKRPLFRLLGHDIVCARRDGQDVLYVAGTDGDQAFAFEVAPADGPLTLTPVAEVFPMRLFGGKGLIVGPGAQPLYDSADVWVSLTSFRRARFAESGAFIVSGLDGKEPDCVWHRLMIDATVPPGCDVLVRSRAGNDESQLAFADWQPEPPPRRRATGTELAWSADLRRAGLETFELLFQRARGRHLQIEITLSGTGRCSPRLRAVRVWYPRFSYLERYLPAVYRESTESASFLDRFLANTEGFFTDIEGRVAASQALVDVRTAPPETLEWLASWFHVALDPAWDEARRRLFIRHAAEFFEWRGTVPGMRMALRLATEACADDSTFALEPRRAEGVRIIERFRTRPLPGLVFTTVNDADGLPVRVTKSRWDPGLGAADLHRRWRELTGDPAARYPLSAPSSADVREKWTAFSLRELGFIPRVGDVTRWRASLQKRYPTLDHLNRAWATAYGRWSDVPLPVELPGNAAALRDWVHFESLVLPAYDAAHRFTVFLPQGTLGLRDRDKRLALVHRVVALEKPAHTAFDVKFYWAFFRVGEARLGEGTVVDLGSRSPELLSPFVLDRHYLGSGYLAAAHAGPPSAATCDCAGRGDHR